MDSCNRTDDNCGSVVADGQAQPQDVFRDTPVRYFGYANELGEAFKALVPRAAYFASYGVAAVYVLGDASHKGTKEFEKSSGVHGSNPTLEAGKAVVDTTIWQGLASVAIPGFIINKVVSTVSTVSRRNLSNPIARRFLPTTMGLACIPFIVGPVDTAVDHFMDNLFRPNFHKITSFLFSKKVDVTIDDMLLCVNEDL
eukprot:m.116674 g.116674  ORF g.116674 m.116674 type:complete len:198 (-) comp12861_c0_seq4:1134-1727(-)